MSPASPHAPRASRSGKPATPFGRWLLAELDDRAMSPAELARLVGRRQAAVSQWCYENPPDLRGVLALAKALGLSIAEIVVQIDPEAVDPLPSTDRDRAHALVRMLPEPLLPVAIELLRALAPTRRHAADLIAAVVRAADAPDRSRHAEGDVATEGARDGEVFPT